MAQALQRDLSALIPELLAARTADNDAGGAPSGSERSNAVGSVLPVKNIRQVRSGLMPKKKRSRYVPLSCSDAATFKATYQAYDSSREERRYSQKAHFCDGRIGR